MHFRHAFAGIFVLLSTALHASAEEVAKTLPAPADDSFRILVLGTKT
jgi:hypothetical protein